MPGSSNIVNVTKIVNQFYLAAGSAVQLQVIDKLFIPELPDLATFNGATTKGIWIVPNGGQLVGERMIDAPYIAHCYGGPTGYTGARAVATAFVNQTRAAHGTDVAAGRVIGAQIESSGQMLREPETNPPWFQELVFFRIQVGP